MINLNFYSNQIEKAKKVKSIYCGISAFHEINWFQDINQT